MAKPESDKVEQTVAAKLWEKIKDIPIDIFALPNQTVGNHAKREEGMDAVFPNDIYLTLRSAAAYPALEEALGSSYARNQIKLAKGERFDLSQSARYTVIKIIKSGM
jgi:hypothetical protein